jgi:hypothetical protein
MINQESSPSPAPSPSPAEVAEHRSNARWTVEERAWKQVLPDLPDEVIALLASPVVVMTEPFAEVEPERQPLEPDAGPYGDRMPRFLAPEVPPVRNANRGAHGTGRRPGTRARARTA